MDGNVCTVAAHAVPTLTMVMHGRDDGQLAAREAPRLGCTAGLDDAHALAIWTR